MSDLDAKRIAWLTEMDKWWLDTYADGLREETSSGNGVQPTIQLVSAYVKDNATPSYSTYNGGVIDNVVPGMMKCNECDAYHFPGRHFAQECEACGEYHLPGEHTKPKRKKLYERVQDSYEYDKARNWAVGTVVFSIIGAALFVLAIIGVVHVGLALLMFPTMISIGLAEDAIPEYRVARRNLKSNGRD